jgi:hypothetical protein
MSPENTEQEEKLLNFKNKEAAEREIRQRRDDEWVHRAAIFGIDYDSKFIAYFVPMTTRVKEGKIKKIRDEFLIATRKGFKLIQVDEKQGGLNKEFIGELIKRQLANNIFHFDKKIISGYFEKGLIINNSFVIGPMGAFECENVLSEKPAIKREINNCRLIDVSVDVPEENIKIIQIRDANWKHIDRIRSGGNPKEAMYREYHIY